MSPHRPLPRVVVRLLYAGAALILWWALASLLDNDLVLPSPRSVLRVVASLREQLLLNAATTALRVAGGWTLGVVTGIVAGLAMAHSRRLHALADPLVEALRPLPPVALVPFFILWFGIGSSGQIVLIALGAFMVLAVSTMVAVGGVPSPYIRAAALLGASTARLYRTVILPAIAPALLGACRVAAALAFGTALAAEFMGAQSGIGFMMMVARRTLNTDTIMAGIIVVGVESYAFDWLLRRVFERLTRWADRPIDVLRDLNEGYAYEEPNA